jgi:phage baseplate assembly protein V
MSRDLFKALAPLARRIRLTACRAVLGTANDAGKLQTAQVELLAGETRDGVERFQNFGFTSVPPAGAEGVYLSLNGSRDQGVLIVVDDRRSRKSGLKAGEAAMHNAEGTAVIHVLADGSIEVTASTTVTVTAPTVRVVGNLEVTGNIVAAGTVADGVGAMATMREAYNSHLAAHHPGASEEMA